MTSFPGSPKLLKAGLVLMDPDGRSVLRTIALQYNPDTLSRTLAPQGVGGDGGDRLEATRLRGPAVETIKLEAEIDATDRLEFPDVNTEAVATGIHSDLAVLETIVYPPSADIAAARALAAQGTLEIIPMAAPLLLFVWGAKRVVPVRITEFTILEEAHDPSLNPIRAKVTLGLRVLSIDDLDPSTRAASIFMAYLQRKEALAGKQRAATLRTLGVEAIP